jgi:predicted DCC family thiol-disulfide oxidoreductase YuxK
MSVTSETVAKLTPLTSAEHPLLLFYDGNCSFCARWVARVMTADAAHRMRIAQQQGPTFLEVRRAHPRLAEIESVVLVERQSDGTEELFLRSTAIRKTIDGLPGFRFFAFVLHVVPTPLSDLG